MYSLQKHLPIKFKKKKKKMNQEYTLKIQFMKLVWNNSIQ